MAGRIPRSFIDDLIARTDIVQLIDSYVPLKKAGIYYKACCPFHNENSPSFTVTPSKQFYYCYGCKATGDAITFLMEYLNIEYLDAIEELASRLNLEVPRENQPNFDEAKYLRQKKQEKERKSHFFEMTELAAKFYQYQLRKNPNKDKAIDYIKSRGISPEIAKEFELGYAPGEWDSLFKNLGKDQQTKQLLLELELTKQSEKGRVFDFFRDRLIFPIRGSDLKNGTDGKVIGFGARLISGEGPKYINSKESDLFKKGKELYGLNRARKKNRKLDQLLVVEGYMDVISLAQFGIDYAVAALGTATTQDHIEALFKLSRKNTVICCYDGDRAGRDAAWRARENISKNLKDGYIAKFLFLDDGEDPDSIVRKIGKEGFEALIEEKSKSFSSFLLEEMKKRYDVTTVDGKANLKAAVIPEINEIPGEQQRQSLLEEVAYLTGETNRVIAEKQLKEANKNIKSQKADYEKLQKMSDSPVRRLIQLLLHAPYIAREVAEVNQDSLRAMNLPGISLLREIHALCLSEQSIMGVQILDHFREHPHYKVLVQLLSKEMPEGKDLQAEFRGNISRLVHLQLEARLEELTSKSRVTKLSKDEMQEIVALTRGLNTGQTVQ